MSDYRASLKRQSPGCKLIVDLGTRRVYWNLSPEQTALLLNSLVSTLGPADGEEPEVANATHVR